MELQELQFRMEFPSTPLTLTSECQNHGDGPASIFPWMLRPVRRTVPVTFLIRVSAMFFRFASAVCLVVLISLVGIAIEKRSLELRRELSRQCYQMDALRDQQARLRFRSQQLAAIERLYETVEQGNSDLTLPEKPAQIPRAARSQAGHRRVPLLLWRQPVDDWHVEKTRP